MKRIITCFLMVVSVYGCMWSIGSDSDGLHINIGDNKTDNGSIIIKTSMNNVYAIGENEPFARVTSHSHDEGQNSIESNDIIFVDICSGGVVVELDAEKIRGSDDLSVAACDFSRCGGEGFDIFDYAERNGFDAYCSAE